MPELPEVENMVLSLKPIINKKINSVFYSNKPLREPVNNNIANLIDKVRIIAIKRVSKYIVFELSNQLNILAHAGMSGRFSIVNNNYTQNKHDHIILSFNNEKLVYTDPRRFGLFLVLNNVEFINCKYLKNIGVDPINENLTAKYLFDKLKNLKCTIKATLLNQKIIAGIGNIYASEILYCANILPTKVSGKLSIKNCEDIVFYTKKVLQKAIKLGGSTLKDYKKANGELGGFQNHFAVYGKENLSCPKCFVNKNPCSIKKIIQNQRSSFFCSNLLK
jgi:formamidopyrimidine-DNA glycosylase